MPVQIVPMSAAHIDAIAALEAVCFSAPWSAAALTEQLDHPAAVFYTALDANGQVCGYAGMHHITDEGYIDNVAVDPAARRQGVARALIAALETYGRGNHLFRLTLEVRISNTAAIMLYENAGFVRDGVRPAFYRKPTEDAAIYSRYF